MKKLIGLLLSGLVVGIGIVYFITSGVHFVGQQDATRLNRPPVVGEEIPELVLENLNGEAIDIAGLFGKPLIINFWATWCPPCKEEMPLLQDFSQANQESISVIGINAMELKTVVKEYVQANEITFTILLDNDGQGQETYRILGLPTTYFVDKDGILRAQHIGILNIELLDKYGNMIGLQQ